MLSQAVLASKSKRIVREQGNYLSPSMVSICPYRTYLSFTKYGQTEDIDPLELLRMEDGLYQEQEIIDNLVFAGFEVTNRQLVVHVGNMVGHIDGVITVDGTNYLLDAKAMSLNRFTTFRQKGLAAETSIKCQMQLYLASEELQDLPGAYIYAKHKDTCRPYDLLELREPTFYRPLIEMTGKIISGFIPDKTKCLLCSACKFRLDPCWGQEILNLSGIKSVSLPEMVAKWKEGKAHTDYGKELIEEARGAFEDELGDKELLIIDDLKVQRIFQHRSGISMEKFVEKFGASALSSVLEEKIVPQMKVTEL